MGANIQIDLCQQTATNPSNLFPIIIESIQNGRPVKVYGSELPTPDGNGVRDYIHVDDLAEGQTATLTYATAHSGYHSWNLGTGRGHSVLEVIQAFSEHLEQPIESIACATGPGDAPECWASTLKASGELNWLAKFNLTDMVRSARTAN